MFTFIDIVLFHRYGDEAGTLAEDSMYTAGNTIMTVYNTGGIGVKAVAKRAAKDTGRAVLEDIQNERTAQGSPDNQRQGTPLWCDAEIAAAVDCYLVPVVY